MSDKNHRIWGAMCNGTARKVWTRSCEVRYSFTTARVDLYCYWLQSSAICHGCLYLHDLERPWVAILRQFAVTLWHVTLSPMSFEAHHTNLNEDRAIKVKVVCVYLWMEFHLTCHLGVLTACHPTQVNTPCLSPSQTGRYSIYLPRRDKRLSWPRWLVTYRDGLPARRRSPIQVLTWPSVD